MLRFVQGFKALCAVCLRASAFHAHLQSDFQTLPELAPDTSNVNPAAKPAEAPKNIPEPSLWHGTRYDHIRRSSRRSSHTRLSRASGTRRLPTWPGPKGCSVKQSLFVSPRYVPACDEGPVPDSPNHVIANTPVAWGSGGGLWASKAARKVQQTEEQTSGGFVWPRVTCRVTQTSWHQCPEPRAP